MLIFANMNYTAYVAYSRHQLELFESGGTVDYAHELFQYIKLNNHRSTRIFDHQPLDPRLVKAVQELSFSQRWLLITEPWCGDAAHSVPLIARMAELNPLVELEILLRDRNLEIMDQYLTDGGRSIPMLIIRDASGKDLGIWGPRPQAAQSLVKELKKQPEISKQEAMEQVQVWYARNKYLDIQEELLNLVEKLERK